MKRYAIWITARPWHVLVAVLLLTLGMATGTRRLTLKNTQDSDLPESDRMVATQREFADVFANPSVVVIGVRADDIYAPQTLQKIRAVSRDLGQVPGVLDNRIVSLTSMITIWHDATELVVAPLVPDRPLSVEDAARVRQQVEQRDALSRRLVASDGKFTVVTAFLEENYDRAVVYQGVRDIIARQGGPEELLPAGDAVFTTASEMGVQADSQRLIPLALVATCLMLFLWFRTLPGVLFPIIVAIFSIVWSLGAMGFLGLPLTVVSSALPVLMIIVSGSHGIHLMLNYYKSRSSLGPREATIEALTRSLPGLLMATGTTALAAATLATFRIRAIREFGVVLALSVVFSSVLALTVIPALLCAVKAKSRPGASSARLGTLLGNLTSWAVARRRLILLAMLPLGVAAVAGVGELKTGNDIVAVFPEHHPVRETFAVFNRELGGARMLNVLLKGEHANAILEPAYYQSVQELQRFAEKLPGVGKVFSYADIVSAFCSDVGERCDQLSTGEIAQYLLLYDLNGTPSEFSQLVDYSYQRANVSLFLTTSDPDVHREVYTAIQGYLARGVPAVAGFEFGGEVMFWLAQVRHVIIGKIENIIGAFGVILVLVALCHRSIVAGLICLAPVLLGTLLIFGTMGAAGVRLDFGTAIITSIAVGVGVDFAIHYISDLAREARGTSSFFEAVTTSGASAGRLVVYQSVSTIVGFSTVMLSGFLPVRTFGLLIAMGMAMTGVSTLILLPALLAAVKPRFLVARKAS
jgi:predicted RND superfamily exporter protein